MKTGKHMFNVITTGVEEVVKALDTHVGVKKALRIISMLKYKNPNWPQPGSQKNKNTPLFYNGSLGSVKTAKKEKQKQILTSANLTLADFVRD